ncbi:MAG: hypothetical protein R3349_09370 [Geminicoccaceae bacterium]|nr:hypothetical protein [Geminicoccaceae bacterium]
MEGFTSFVDWAVLFVQALNERAADLDGRAAFVLGLLTWFVVEQAIRKLAGALRIAIIVGAVGAGGLGVAAAIASLTEGPPASDSP